MHTHEDRQNLLKDTPAVVRLAALFAVGSSQVAGIEDGEWQEIVTVALQQDVGPALYGHLKDASVSLPQPAEEPLHRSYRANVARNMWLFHELTVILQALQRGNIPVVPFKGAQLAKTVYQDIAHRPMGDLDLWVQRQQLEGSREVMRRLGYARSSRRDRPPGLQDALLGETQMFKTDAPLVELHWNIFPGEWVRHTTQIDEQEIWKRSTPLDGDTVRQLAPEDAIIHLCVHLAVNHQMSGIGLRTLVDLDRARRTWTVDWTVVARRARAWRVSVASWIVLNALGELFGDPQGQLPLRSLAPSRLRQFVLHRFAAPRMFAGGLNLSAGPRRFLFLLSLVDRPVDAVVLAWRAVFPDRLWLTLRYESPEASSWGVAWLRLRHLVNITSAGRF